MNANRVQKAVVVITSTRFLPEDQVEKKQTKSENIKNRIRVFETKNREITLFSKQIVALQYLPVYNRETRPLQNLNLQLKSLPFVLSQFL